MLLFSLVFSLISTDRPPRQPDPHGYVCFRADRPIAIDGKLDDDAWASAPWSEAFVDIEGDSKPKPRLKTRMKMLWDDRCLYIAAELEEPHLWGTLTEHDSIIFQDNDFEVFLDSDGDNHNYGELEVNAKNTTWDLFLTKPYRDAGRALHAWEIVGLKTAVHLDGSLNNPKDTDRGWTLEIAWPWAGIKELSSAAMPPKDGDQWRINFSRVQWDLEVIDGAYGKVKGKPEHNWVWSPQGVVDMHRPERWGYLQFSAGKPGTAKFKPDPDRVVRDRLHRVYEAQREYRTEHAVFAASAGALKLDGDFKSLRLERTQSSFEADLPSLVDPNSRWVISQDSCIRKASTPSEKIDGAANLWWDAQVERALVKAGDNRKELEKALLRTPNEQRIGMAFLVANMPETDLSSLNADFLLSNLAWAYKARRETPWGKDVPEAVFLNDVLPYANLDEHRDDWRKKFFDLCMPIANSSKTPSEAAHRINSEIFKKLNVQYSTQRKAPNQSPAESIETGKASCTGLSIVLVDACRAVCIPARVVGTPMWANKRGNHTWVEIWDGGWRFTGACEADPQGLDRGWFVGDAALAVKDSPEHAIYAASFQKTDVHFPLAWNRRKRDIPAVNVTDRYAKTEKPTAETVLVMVRVVNAGKKRIAVPVTVSEVGNTAVLHTEQSRSETNDANDFATFKLLPNRSYTIKAAGLEQTIKTKAAGVKYIFELVVPEPPRSDRPNAEKSTAALKALKDSLASKAALEAVAAKEFAKTPLTIVDAKAARELLWQSHAEKIRSERGEEMKSKSIKDDKLEMRFDFKTFGEKPGGGRSLWISMHGGGGAPKRVNDHQWENQKKLYTVDEGIYLAPRAPTDTWNLWHEPHIDRMFARLIENMIVFEDVNPDRVYLLGYSAGGDGVYQMAPRMADWWAGAAMMAGHPNGVSLQSVRNVPFALQVGGNDGAYNRNTVAKEYGDKLGELKENDPNGYEHFVKIYEGKGHWMDREDKAALPWMAKFTRNPTPDRVVWKQTGVPHERSYWLAVPKEQAKVDSRVVAEYKGQTVQIDVAEKVSTLIIRFDDRMVDLEQPIVVKRIGGTTLFTGSLSRTIATMIKTLASRGDPKLIFDAEVLVEIPHGG